VSEGFEIMGIGKAAFLGLIQGITEFLPISSSGHLVILEHFLKVKPPGVTFEIFLHFGTLLAILVFFRRQIRNISRRMVYFIIVGTIPTGLIGFFFKSGIENFFFGAVKPVASMLLISGLLLWLAERRELALRRRVPIPQPRGQMNALDALLIGIMQGIALIPGISRVGSTVSLGLFRGLKRELAAQYSFFLSIPAILGANLLALISLTGKIGIRGLSLRGLENINISAIIVGVGIAFLSGYLAIEFLLKILYQKKFSIFAYYCWTLGILILLFN
jgi:undecaprenyl-diphosphatase